MTTIATDGRTMAGDGRACQGDEVASDGRRKLTRLDDGSVVGMAGDSAGGELVLDWLKRGGKREDVPNVDPGDFEVVVLRLYPDGRLRYLSAPFLVELEVDAPFAIGSGKKYARGAMLAGASPVEAVRIAALVDIGTGGDVLELEPGKAK